MNIEEERKLFEANYTKIFGPFPECLIFENNCYSLISIVEHNPDFKNIKLMISCAWLMWWSSVEVHANDSKN